MGLGREQGKLGALLSIVFREGSPFYVPGLCAQSCCRCHDFINKTGNAGRGVSVGSLVFTALLGFSPFSLSSAGR